MLGLVFLLCLVVHALQGVMGWKIALLAFAPFLAVCLVRGKAVVWLAMAAGLFVDLLSNDPMGLHAINYAATCILLGGWRRGWCFEQPLHLGLYTAMISWTSTILQGILLFLFDRRVLICGKWALIDIFCMPMIDGLYAVLWLSGPIVLWRTLHYKWGIYWTKKRMLSRISR